MSQEQRRPRCSACRTGKRGQAFEQTARQQVQYRREPQGQQDQNGDPSVDDPEFDIMRLPFQEFYTHGSSSLSSRSWIHHRTEGGNHGAHEYRSNRNNKPTADKERQKHRKRRLAARGLVGMLEADENDHQRPDPRQKSAAERKDQKKIGRLAVGHDPEGRFKTCLGALHHQQEQMKHAGQDEQPQDDEKGCEHRKHRQACALKRGILRCCQHLRRHEILHDAVESDLPEIREHGADHAQDQAIEQGISEAAGHGHFFKKITRREQDLFQRFEQSAEEPLLFTVLPGCLLTHPCNRRNRRRLVSLGNPRSAVLTERLAFRYLFAAMGTEHTTSGELSYNWNGLKCITAERERQLIFAQEEI